MLKCVAVVERGKVHKTNDDAALVQHSVLHEGFFMGNYDDEGVFAVADGVGSLEQSELASRMVLRTISECTARKSEDMYSAIVQSNTEVMNLKEKRELQNDISTTLCAISVLADRIISYNVGNSRLYQFRHKYLRQLTRDHTRVQELYENGMISYEHMSSHSDSHVITRCIGDRRFESVWIDVTEHKEDFVKGDILLLCSDGVHEYVPLDYMEDILQKETDILEKAFRIVNASLEQGGNDNATIILILKQ